MNIQDTAERALARMRRQGFDEAQVGASVTVLTELNLNHNEPSLMRSTEQHKLSLLGIVDGRKASTELGNPGDDEAVRERIASLFADAGSAPHDEANAVSGGQRVDIVQGPQAADEALLADKVRELLLFRERETPKMMLEESALLHATQ